MYDASYPQKCAQIIQKKVGAFSPKVGMVLGSGLTNIVKEIDSPIHIDYRELPGFPQPGVKGHVGSLTLGYLNDCPVVCLQGRAHFYETLNFDAVKVYTRTLNVLGCEIFLATNASGSLHADIGSGSLVAIRDHINFIPANPLGGPNDDLFGPRFIPLDPAYDVELRHLLQSAAEEINLPLPEGIYLAVPGPSYETAAEIRAFKILGADLVGMSTIPEVIVANHCGMRVMAIATVTNLATGLNKAPHDHDNVVKVAAQAAEKLSRLIKCFVKKLS